MWWILIVGALLLFFLVSLYSLFYAAGKADERVENLKKLIKEQNNQDDIT